MTRFYNVTSLLRFRKSSTLSFFFFFDRTSVRFRYHITSTLRNSHDVDAANNGLFLDKYSAETGSKRKANSIRRRTPFGLQLNLKNNRAFISRLFVTIEKDLVHYRIYCRPFSNIKLRYEEKYAKTNM